jgi:hypothetical protein
MCSNGLNTLSKRGLVRNWAKLPRGAIVLHAGGPSGYRGRWLSHFMVPVHAARYRLPALLPASPTALAGSNPRHSILERAALHPVNTCQAFTMLVLAQGGPTALWLGGASDPLHTAGDIRDLGVGWGKVLRGVRYARISCFLVHCDAHAHLG